MKSRFSKFRTPRKRRVEELCKELQDGLRAACSELASAETHHLHALLLEARNECKKVTLAPSSMNAWLPLLPSPVIFLWMLGCVACSRDAHGQASEDAVITELLIARLRRSAMSTATQASAGDAIPEEVNKIAGSFLHTGLFHLGLFQPVHAVTSLPSDAGAPWAAGALDGPRRVLP